jgi:VIT1/CCC1 family predicted Fe2+/Mn2+ transporter
MEYSPDFVHGAIDGLVTTFAVVNGAMGARVSLKTVIILGLVNVFADGFTIAAGKYLAAKAEVDVLEKEGKTRHVSPMVSAVTIFITFVLAGMIPLIPLIVKYFTQGDTLTHPKNMDAYLMAMYAITAVTLYGVGWVRGKMTNQDPNTNGKEVLLIGGCAAIIALFIGHSLHAISK